MKPLSANRAAKEAGIAKKTLLEALNEGRLTGSKNDQGHWKIDPAELFRVFPPKENENQSERFATPQETVSSMEMAIKIGQLEAELKFANERLADKADKITELEADKDDLKGQRDKWQGQAERLLLDKPQPAPVGVSASNENTQRVGQGDRLTLKQRLTGKA